MARNWAILNLFAYRSFHDPYLRKDHLGYTKLLYKPICRQEKFNRNSPIDLFRKSKNQKLSVNSSAIKAEFQFKTAVNLTIHWNHETNHFTIKEFKNSILKVRFYLIYGKIKFWDPWRENTKSFHWQQENYRLM